MSRELREVVGSSCRRLRDERELLQEDVARSMRSLGFPWTRAVVAGLEMGRRQLTLAELVGLCNVLDVPLVGLLSGKEHVTLDGTDNEVSLARVRDVLERGTVRGRLVGGLERAIVAHYEEQHEAVDRAARTLGTTPADVAREAQRLWGRSFIEEREHRITDAGAVTRRSLQARRGHVTRQLLDELRTSAQEG